MEISQSFLHAFASTPVRTAAVQRAVQSTACASCGESGCSCNSAADEAQANSSAPVDELELSAEALAVADQEATTDGEPGANVTADAGTAASGAGTAGTEQGDVEAEQTGASHVATEDPGGDEPEEAAAGTNEAEGPQVGQELSEEEQQQLAELKSRDREVRAHEQAHLAAAGPHATGGPSFEYQEGPDGRRYAVGGEVGIDTSPVAGDPEATIQKAQQIRAAALAPASPSSQDQRVAAAATQMESQARAELAKQKQTGQTSAATYGNSEAEQVTGTLLDLVA